MMRRQKSFHPARPHMSHTAGVLTAQAAAGRLSRLEFDIARLEREISVAELRASRARKALVTAVGERRTLLGIIARPPAALQNGGPHGA